MEGFIHLRMPLWLRRLVTRLLSVIPVLICVMMTSNKPALEEHEALNTLMNNSQVFLAFALPFSMLPLLMFTDSRVEMGDRFKNSWLIKSLGWLSVVGLTYLNMMGLPGQIEAFYGDHASAAQLATADRIAYVLIAGVMALLVWMIIELYKGNKRFEQQLATEN